MTDFEIFITVNKLKKKDIALYLGVSNAFVTQLTQGLRGLPNDKFDSIKANESWDTSMLTDEGEIMKDAPDVSLDNKTQTGKVIPLYDAEAAAGVHYGMNMEAISRPIGMIEIGSILKDSESALRVYGNSMTPNYPAGCIVGLRPHTDSFIEPGYVYVVETNENRYLKRLYNNSDKSALRCLSDNHMLHDSGPMEGELYYPEFEIPLTEVSRLFRVVGVIKRNIL